MFPLKHIRIRGRLIGAPTRLIESEFVGHDVYGRADNHGESVARVCVVVMFIHKLNLYAAPSDEGAVEQ